MECERWNGRGCVVDAATERGFSDVALSDIEVCPWPSRKVPVKQSTVEEAAGMVAQNAYNAGRRAGIEECMEAVSNDAAPYPIRCRIIAALAAVAPEEMEYIAPCSKCGQPHIAPTADCHYDNRRAKEDEHDAE